MNSYLKPNQQAFWQWLRSELSERMSQNLPFIKMSPKEILLFGGFDEKVENFFLKTYPDAKLWSDSTQPSSWLQNLNPWKSQGAQNFNFADFQEGFLDLIWAGPLCVDLEKFPEFFNQTNRLLKKQGLMMFNYLGPDTARQYRSVLKQTGNIGPDMHDIGDMLIQAGFADPVMNMEYIHLEYDNISLLMRDLLGMGLLSAEEFQSSACKENIEKLDSNGGTLQLTLEVVYGHAWKVDRKPKGVSTISVESIGKSYKK
jgi:malonyl-CoA O-methyltransferase